MLDRFRKACEEEGEAMKSTEKADGIECKFIEIEDELKVGLIKEIQK